MKRLLLITVACAIAAGQGEMAAQLLSVKRVYVDRLTGGDTAAQMRDLLITALQSSKLFVLTENAERADAFLRGAAEDLVYTDSLQSSESTNIHDSNSNTSHSAESARAGGNVDSIANSTARALSLGVGENESINIKERKHEAIATVRLVNKDGDVLWSTTQESKGAKFRGASADVADRIARQLVAEYDRQRKPAH